jgi:hypothetical protein
MNSYSCSRSAIRASVCAAVLVAAAVSFGAAADRHQVQAQVLDHAEFLCANCFYGPSDYYYCFAADNQILVGYQRTRVMNWQDKSKNHLTKVQDGWEKWTPPGMSVPLSYDAKHIWVSRPDGKPVRLTRSSMRDIFINNDQCRAANANGH